MIERRHVLMALAALVAAPPAWAADPTVDRILRELRGLGYSSIEVERTLLGRTRIVADSREASREIIVNPATGEILRDLWIPHMAEAEGSSGLLGGGSSDGGGDGGDGNSGSGGGDGGSDDGSGDDHGGSDDSGDDGGGDDHGGKDDGGGKGKDD